MSITLDELKKYKEKNQGISQVNQGITLDDLRKYKSGGSIDFNDKNSKASSDSLPKTQIDQRLTLFKSGNKTLGDFWLGNNLIPAYKEDSTLAKIGKGAVNLIGGTVANIFGAPQQAMMQTTRAGVNAIQGKPQDFSEMNFSKDILGMDENNVVGNIIGMALDPITYIGGGILDDMAKIGRFGKGATLGTAENLAANAAMGQRATKNLPLTIADELIPTKRSHALHVDQYGNIINDINKKPLLLEAANIPETKVPTDFYAKGDIITKQPGVTSVDLTTPDLKLLPEGKPIAKNTGEEMLKLIRKGANIPEYSNAKGLKEVPFTVTKDGYVEGARLLKKASDVPINPEIKPVDYTVGNEFKREFPKRITPADKVNVISDLKSTIQSADELPTPTSKIVSGTKKEKFTWKNAWNKFYTRVADIQHPISQFSKEAKDETFTMSSNSRNVGGTVDYILKDGLVDKAGNKIGKSLKEVAEQIPKGKEEDFWTYMSQRHNIDRAREGKPVQANYTPEMSLRAVEAAEKINPEWKQIGDNITNWIDQFMRTWGVDAGTIDKTVYDDLRKTYKSYFPTQRDFSTLEKSIPDGIRKKFIDNTTPVRKATGSERDIIDPLENIMNLVNRTVRTAKYNEVGRTLLNSIREAPEKLKKYAEVIKLEEGRFSNTDNVVSVLENGKPVYMKINNKELLDSLNNMPKIINNAKAMRAITGVYKGLITQKNPLFAIRNIFRDLPTAYVYGSTKNPIKFAKDLGGAVKDIATNSENFQRYRAVGGGGSNFFNSGDVTKSARQLTGNKNIFSKIGEGIETVNNYFETAPRLAEFNRTLEKTGDINKALFAANDVTVNFARGGDITKKAEPFVPYLNAGVQGLDKFFRGFKDVKTATATLTKAGISITAPTIALYLINKDDPNYQQLDNRTKDTYYLIPKNDGTFFKIPKSRELGVLFSALFERSLRAANGEKDAFKGFFSVNGNPLEGTVAANFAPANPIENNFFSPVIYNIPANKDFAGRAIVPQNMIQDKRSPYLQHDEKTSEIAKWIGSKTNLSPKQIDYLLRSYTGIIGQIGLPATTKNSSLPQAVGKVLSSQFIADPVYNNQTVVDFYDNYNRLQRIAADKNILDKIPSRAITSQEAIKNRFGKASDAISRLNKQIMAAQGDEERIKELRQKIIDIAKSANDMLE